MNENRTRTLPRWMFTILAMGAMWASGVYLGIMSVSGATTPDIVRAIGFGALALVMAWGAIAQR